jgi:hypothetical protein
MEVFAAALAGGYCSCALSKNLQKHNFKVNAIFKGSLGKIFANTVP